MTSRMKYSDHLDALIALISNLALTQNKSRTPKNLAKYLGLDEQEVRTVLTGFKGIFRESIKPNSEGEHFYTIQMRYAQRWMQSQQDSDDAESDNPSIQEPLTSEYLTSLLNFIANMVGQEASNKRQGRDIFVAIFVAFLALGGAILGLLK